MKDNKSDQEAADSVAAKINGIGTVTLDSEEVIREAREAYEGLTDNQKELISLEQLKVLIEAEKTLKELKENKANQEAADSVTAKINGIGTVTLDSRRLSERQEKPMKV